MAQQQELGITQKTDALKLEAGVTRDLIQDSTIGSKQTMLEAIDAAVEQATEFTEEILEKFRNKAQELDRATNLPTDSLKEIKKELKDLVAQFCAESSIYKVSKFAIDSQTKTISQHLKKMHKQDRKTKALAMMPSDDAWSSNPVALAVLGCDSPCKHYSKDEAAEVSCKIDGIPDDPIAVKLPAALQWVEKVKNGQYFKTQKHFLQTWLKKNDGYSCQETTITVKLLQGELDKFAKDLPVDLGVHGDAAKAPWGKSFSWNVGLSSHHCQVGVGSFCLGELLFGVEGALAKDALKETIRPMSPPSLRKAA